MQPDTTQDRLDVTPQKVDQIAQPSNDCDANSTPCSILPNIPTQSPLDKTEPVAKSTNMQQSEEEYMHEVQTIQRKAEERLQTYVDQQLHLRKKEFERRTQTAAEKVAANWTHDGLTIDEIIEINFKEYEQQYEGLYTKALALKRAFEHNKQEFERQMQFKFKAMYGSQSRGSSNNCYGMDAHHFDFCDEQQERDSGFTNNIKQSVKITSKRVLEVEMPAEIKRAAIRKPFRAPIVRTDLSSEIQSTHDRDQLRIDEPSESQTPQPQPLASDLADK